MFRRTTAAVSFAVVAALSATSASALQVTQPAGPPAPSVAVPAPADAKTTAPAVEALQATITGIEGVVQVRKAEDQPWQKATVGMVLDQNAEFRTGPRSAVRFTIPPDQTITLDRLGTVKVLQAVNDNGKIKTNLGMRYGRTRYDIEAAGREHEASISSPSSTLAVRGTKVSLYDQRPFISEAVSLTGRAEFRDARKRVRFGGPGAGKLKVNEKDGSAAEASLANAVVDPGAALARSASESGLIETLLSRGATVSYDYEKGIKVVRGGVPPTDGELIPVLPGSLNFVLRWTGDSDVNLAVLSPRSDTTVNSSIYPIGGLNVVSNGGRTDFDHRGGPSGGIEIGYWPGPHPAGRYAAGAVLISGESTPATLDVFRGGERVDIFTSGGLVQTVSTTVEPINPEFGSGQLLGLVTIDPDAQTASAASVKSATSGATKKTASVKKTSTAAPAIPKVANRRMR